MTTCSFPLYNQLSKKVYTSPYTLSTEQKCVCAETIKKMSSNEHEIIYALIRFYQVETNENSCYTLPYKSKFQKSGLKVDLDKLPNDLQCILYEFTHLYLQTS